MINTGCNAHRKLIFIFIYFEHIMDRSLQRNTCFLSDLNLLVFNFNPHAVVGLMCTNTKTSNKDKILKPTRKSVSSSGAVACHLETHSTSIKLIQSIRVSTEIISVSCEFAESQSTIPPLSPTAIPGVFSFPRMDS